MLIRLHEPAVLSSDGFSSRRYEAGEHDVSEALAAFVVREGLGVKVLPQDYERKVVEPRASVAFDAGEHSVREVLALVANGRVTAAAALESEQRGKNRKTLLAALRDA